MCLQMQLPGYVPSDNGAVAAPAKTPEAPAAEVGHRLLLLDCIRSHQKSFGVAYNMCWYVKYAVIRYR